MARRPRSAFRALWQRQFGPAFGRRAKGWSHATHAVEASVIIVTFNRLRMLRVGLESLLRNAGDIDFEVIVWDNASGDGTGEYLDELAKTHDVLRVVHSRANIGLNGIAEAVEMARGFYIVEADDDVIAYPQDWLRRMVAEFRHIPRAGYLAANVVQDEKTNGSKPGADCYKERDFGEGVILEEGPAGGWCSVTSLETLGSIGNFGRMPGRKFFLFDGEYAERCTAYGWRIGVIKDVVVYHAAGPVLNREYGYLDLCEQKYSESPEFSWALEATRRVRNEG